MKALLNLFLLAGPIEGEIFKYSDFEHKANPPKAKAKSPKMAAGPPGMIVAPSGAVYKPEECGMDGLGNGWCAGESVPAEFFLEKDKVKAAKKEAAKQKKKQYREMIGMKEPQKRIKKSDTGNGRNQVVKLKSNTMKPKSAAQSGGNLRVITGLNKDKDKNDNPYAGWIIAGLFLIAIPVSYFIWKLYLKKR